MYYKIIFLSGDTSAAYQTASAASPQRGNQRRTKPIALRYAYRTLVDNIVHICSKTLVIKKYKKKSKTLVTLGNKIVIILNFGIKVELRTSYGDSVYLDNKSIHI